MADTKLRKPPPRAAAFAPPATNRPAPIRTLRDWLDHLAARERIAVTKPRVGLRFELAAIAKRLDGRKATLFPRPDGHAIPVASGLVSDRGWIAEAMGREPAEIL
jgi:2,5-furandicarboxylate decarboxylase 1